MGPARRRVSGDLRDALAADRAIRRRAARNATPIPGGLALRHAGLDDVHFLNAVLLDAGPRQLAAEDVEAVADAWLGGLGHRHVVFDDEAAAERAAATLGDRGWERTRTTFLVFAGDPVAVAADVRARPISASEMQDLQLEALRLEAPEKEMRTGLVERLVATQTLLRGTTRSRCFGAGDPGHPLASMCTIFLDEDVNRRRVGTVAEVGTLPDARGRGLAHAVVLAAVEEAARWGAELIVVAADADDWPQLMYARLGFEPVGRQVKLTRRLRRRVGGSDSVAGAL